MYYSSNYAKLLSHNKDMNITIF